MLMMLGCGGFVSVTHLGAISADAHDAWLWGFVSVTHLGAIPADAHNAWLWGVCFGDAPRNDPS